jgi:hypothetical protein
MLPLVARAGYLPFHPSGWYFCCGPSDHRPDMRKIRSFRFVFLLLLLGSTVALAATKRWSPEKANQWYAKQPWPVGANFAPSTAINQLEMWQADSFDPVTIDREFGWAQEIGFNTMRVFLHNLLWQQDATGFQARMDKFLTIADKHGISVTFVLLDGVWDPHPVLGKQRDPRPHVHNSGWLQAPGAELLDHPERWDTELKPYVEAVIRRFGKDRRILMWDLFNEPDNTNDSYARQETRQKERRALDLLQKTFTWARQADPDQPLTSGVWKGDWSRNDRLGPVERVQLENSDVITFHNYDPPNSMQQHVGWLERFHRPIVCTEYMARPRGSTFQSILPWLKQQKIGAYNWGFVSGKTQTIYPWDSWEKKYTAEPTVWFHDIFLKDGRPYDPKEVTLIKRLTRKNIHRQGLEKHSMR